MPQLMDIESEQDDTQSTRTTTLSRYPQMRKLLEIQQALEKQVFDEEIEETESGSRPRVNAIAKASCARAWKELEMLRRIMMGKPVQVEPAKLKLPRARKLGNVVPLPAQQAEPITTPSDTAQA